MSLTIDKNVALPELRKYGLRDDLRKIVKQMEVGDSVHIPGKTANDVSTALSNLKEDLREQDIYINFTCRTDKDKKGCRFWVIPTKLAKELTKNQIELIGKLQPGNSFCVRQIDEDALLEYLDTFEKETGWKFEVNQNGHPGNYDVHRVE